MTTYAYFDNGVFVGEYDEDELPASAQRQTRGHTWITNLRNADPADQRTAGWYRITPTPPPPDTPTTTHDRALTRLDETTIIETWQPRPKTDTERATDNAADIERDATFNIDAIRQTVDNIRTILDTPNATINAGPAPAIKAMARDCLDIARQTIRLARLTTGTTNTTATDIGTGTATTTHEWMITV